MTDGELTHDDDQRVLLDRKLSRIDAEPPSFRADSPLGQLLPGFTNGEEEDLGHDVADGQGRL